MRPPGRRRRFVSARPGARAPAPLRGRPRAQHSRRAGSGARGRGERVFGGLASGWEDTGAAPKVSAALSPLYFRQKKRARGRPSWPGAGRRASRGSSGPRCKVGRAVLSWWPRGAPGGAQDPTCAVTALGKVGRPPGKCAGVAGSWPSGGLHSVPHRNCRGHLLAFFLKQWAGIFLTIYRAATRLLGAGNSTVSNTSLCQ